MINMMYWHKKWKFQDKISCQNGPAKLDQIKMFYSKWGGFLDMAYFKIYQLNCFFQ